MGSRLFPRDVSPPKHLRTFLLDIASRTGFQVSTEHYMGNLFKFIMGAEHVAGFLLHLVEL